MNSPATQSGISKASRAGLSVAAMAGMSRFVSEQLGLSDEHLAPIVAGSLTIAEWAGSFLTSYYAGRAAEQHSAAPSPNDDLLQNSDWLKLSAIATAALLRDAADNNSLPDVSSDKLKNLADAVETEWLNLADTAGFQDLLEGIDRHTAVEWFGAAARNEKPQALDVATWKLLLRPLGKQHNCLPFDDGDGDADENTPLGQVAVLLRDKHPQAVYRLLKHPEGKRAFSGLMLTMLGEIHHTLCHDLVTRIDELQQAAKQTQEKVEQLGPNIQQWITELTPAAAETIDKDRLATQFEDLTDQWQNVCEQTVLMYVNQEQILDNQRTTHSQLENLTNNVQSLTETVEDISKQLAADRREDTVVSVEAGANRIRISNVHRHMFVDRLFVGRDALLKKLHATLRKQKKAAVTQTTAIHGLGGVGKTQLALEYSRRFADDYDIVWWLRAENPDTLLVDLAELAVPLQLLQPGQAVENQQAIAHAVLDEISRRPRWLLIYDNVETRQQLKGWLPGGDGHILITSRDRDWQSVASPFEVAVLNKTESRKLIKERSGQNDTQAADEIAGRLGFLPLALEVAAAYCAATSLPLSEYVSLLEEVGLELLDETQPADYATIVSKAWQPSFQNAIAESEHAATVLGVLAHVAPDNFPEELLEESVGGKRQLNAAIAALQKYSLIVRRKSHLSIHRLVQEVYRSTLTDESSSKFAELALQLVNSAFPQEPGDVRTWPVCDALLPHAVSVTIDASDAQNSGERNPLTRLLSCVAIYHLTRANHSAAEPLMRRALVIDQNSLGENHPNVARELNNLGQLLQATNRLGEAEPMMRRALAIDEQSFGENHPNVARDLNNLALLLHDTNRLSEAEPLMRRALAIDEQYLGQDHPDVAGELNNLAQILQATNRLGEAEPMMRRALSIDEQSFGENHPNVARDLNNLALLLQDTNRLGEAEPMMIRALLIDEQTFGENHPNVAIRLNNLAQLLQDTNRVDEAEPMMSRALAIDEQSFGENHPNVAIRLNNLARLLHATNRLEEAEPLMRRHVEIFRQFGVQTGHEHPHMQAAIRNYALLMQAMELPEQEIAARLRTASGTAS